LSIDGVKPSGRAVQLRLLLQAWRMIVNHSVLRFKRPAVDPRKMAKFYGFCRN
jgi:hypothetical protein